MTLKKGIIRCIFIQRESLAISALLSLFLFTQPAFAAIEVESAKIDAIVPYTLNDIRTDINLFTTENRRIIVQFFDNNALRDQQAQDVNSADGNKTYYQYHFTTKFLEGKHVLDINIADSNSLQVLDIYSFEITVLANPIIGDENISWNLIQTYILPIARSLSECLVQKTDLNMLYTRSESTMKALENDVIIANTAKQAAEDLLTGKTRENEACSSARATCEADKATLDSKLSNARNDCDGEKILLKNEEETECNEFLLVKEETIEERGSRVLELTQSGLEMEAMAAAGVLGLCLTWIAIMVLYVKGRIR